MPSYAQAAEGAPARARKGQAMIETVLAVVVITSLFLALFKLSYMLTGKVILEHAAMRVARARAVGLNEFMCIKSARVAAIPIAGRRLWPQDEEFGYSEELANIGLYMGSVDEGEAHGYLDYEKWPEMRIRPGDGTDTKVGMDFDLFDGQFQFGLDGEAHLEGDYRLYLNDEGR